MNRDINEYLILTTIYHINIFLHKSIKVAFKMHLLTLIPSHDRTSAGLNRLERKDPILDKDSNIINTIHNGKMIFLVQLFIKKSE